MTSAPVTAPTVSREDRRREIAARTFYSTHSLIGAGAPTGGDYARAERLLKAIAERGDAAYAEVPDGGRTGLGALLRVAIARADNSYRQEMLRLHGWDELAFGGAICITCTPEDAAGPDATVSFPCKPLREAGVTEDMAADLIRAHYAEQERRIHEAHKAATTKLPEIDGFHDYDGITVGYVGDYGDMVALGWHANPRTVLHAFDCLARTEAQIDGVYDDPNRRPAPEDLTRTWARNVGHGTGEEQWCLTWGAETTADTAGAFPITLLEM